MSQAVVNIFGRLTKDAEVRKIPTKNGEKEVIEINVAADFYSSGQKEPVYFKCTSFNARHVDLRNKLGALNKGNTVFISGRLGMRKYDGKNGPGVSLEVEVFDIDLASKSENSSDTAGSDQPAQAAPAPQQQPKQAPQAPAASTGASFF